MKKTLFTAIMLCLLTGFTAIAGLRDSIGLERKNGSVYILHRIEYGETLYGISKRYGIDTKVITDNNSNINFTNLQIGQIIRIPHQVTVSGSGYVAANPNGGNNGMSNDYADNNQTGSSNVSTAPKKQQIGYMVRMGDSLYAIAKKFKTDLYTLKAQNNLTSNDLQPGQVLLVEIEGPALGSQSIGNGTNNAVADNSGSKEVMAAEEVPSWAYAPAAPAVDENSEMVHLVHTIEAGNTFASIAAQYGINEARIRELNKMDANAPLPSPGNNVVIGISYIPKSGSPKKVIDNSSSQVVNNNTYVGENTSYNTDNSGLNTGIPSNRRIVGIGARITGNSTIPSNKALALHATAHEGTYIKVSNPNNGKYTLVKVVGKLSASDAGNSTVIKLSQAACQTLGISEDRFQIVLEYND